MSHSLVYVLAAISQDGRLTTNAFMAEYNQDRFELEVQAKETQPPERTTMAKVLVSIKSEGKKVAIKLLQKFTIKRVSGGKEFE